MASHPEESLLPAIEPTFMYQGQRYIAHCVRTDLGPDLFEVCVYEIRNGWTKYIGYGVYCKNRFRSEEIASGLRRVIQIAIINQCNE